MHNTTPLQMGILLAAYSGNHDFVGCDTKTDTWREQCEILINAGMIVGTSIAPRHIGITEKGRFWLDFVLDIPYPTKVCKYEIGAK